jgi:integrase/recombinase XerD
MNLQCLIEQYIALRQSMGECYRNSAATLRAFGRVCGRRTKITAVRKEQVSSFLMGKGALTATWFRKYSALLGFYRYAVSRGHVDVAPLPTLIPKRPPPFVPYIYSHEELRRLLHAAKSYQGRCSFLEPMTIHSLVLLLYGTGLRVSEALNLDKADVDCDKALITVRRTKFYKSRLVPIGPQVAQELIRYAARPSARCRLSTKTPFFTTRYGEPVVKETFEHTFRRVCEQAGIRRSDGASYQPRLHDLRHTFAVHRLTSWYRQGANVQRLLPQLSVYLGHVHISATQVYLSMTPELLAEANARFEQYAGKESDHV